MNAHLLLETARTISFALVLATACTRRAQPPEVSPAAMEAHLRQEKEGRLVYVRVRAAPAGSPPALKIEEARLYAAQPPLLFPADGLAGLVELLDANGGVRWSMGYVPSRDGEAISMRLPAVDGAASVRLNEPARKATVVAPIAPLATR
jgi:hypothetical protein